MRLFFASFLFGLLAMPLPVLAATSVQITEFASAGRQGLRDEDGDTPDWIELQNLAIEPVNLEGWVLSEASRRPEAWTLPATNLAPGECLVLFASGKNRRVPGRPLHTNFKLRNQNGTIVLRNPSGEESRIDQYPAQVAGVSFGLATAGEAATEKTVLIGPNSPLRYVLPFDDQYGTNWLRPDFDDSRWRRGRNGIGYDTAGDDYREFLRTDLRQTMAGRCAGLYLRIPFVCPDNPGSAVAHIAVQYDDGFIAWLNGVEVARRNAPASALWNSVAPSTRPDDKSQVSETIGLPKAAHHLIQGTNWLAVHVLNASLESSDLLFRVQMEKTAVKGPTLAMTTPLYSYLVTSTPGGPNSPPVHSGPQILALGSEAPNPASPPGALLVVTTKVERTLAPVASVRLVYRVLSGSEVEAPMFDDGKHQDGAAGDQIYGAAIPGTAAKAGELLRYFVLAQDEKAVTSRWPLFADRPNYSSYQGTVIPDPSRESHLPILQLFSNRDSQSGRRIQNSVSVYYDGELYDNVTMSSHGQISRNFPKHSFNLRFPNDHPLRCRPGQPRVKGLSVLANYADKSKIRNTLAYEMIAASGCIGHFALPVRVEINGKFFSVAEIVERGDERWLQRVGLDPQGALYKMNSNLSSGHGAEKKTRRYENNRDLSLLAAALSEDRPLEQRAAYAYSHINLPQCVSYFVAMTLISSDDHGHKNYYLYQDSRNTGEWALLPWDVDLSWGHNWTGEYFNESIFSDNPLNLYRNGRSKPSNRLYNLFFGHPELRAMYLRRLRTVMDEVLQAPGKGGEAFRIEKRVQELMDQIDPPGVRLSDADLDDRAWPSWGTHRTAREEAQRITGEHLPGRRNYLFKGGRARLLGDVIPPSQPKDLKLELGPAASALPAEQQFVALTNPHPFAVDLSGWQVAGGGISHRFRPGTVLPRGKALCLVAQVAQFRLHPPPGAGPPPLFVQGDWTGTLDRGKGPLELIGPDGRKVASRSVD